MQKPYDAIIIGGGPGGSTAAAVLAEAGWRVALIEQKAFPRRKVCGEFMSLTNWPVLERLGVARDIQACAGPEVTHMAVYAGARIARSELPISYGAPGQRGRALTRDRLDVLLLERARALGAEILQPFKVLSAKRSDLGYSCVLKSVETREQKICDAKIVVAANGSWEASPFESAPKKAARAGDLFGFKAHFRNAALPDGLMPLLSFTDGYGGMVHCQDGLASLSCCIRRSRLNKLRAETGAPFSERGAGESVLEHIRQTCPAISPVFESAERDGPWLSAGPIQPGIRERYRARIFSVGNAAAEAHPVIAEGISIAIQSAWMMGGILAPMKENLGDANAIDAAGRAYSNAWYATFSTRIRASAWIAQWAMHPGLVQAAFPVFERWPRVLKWCAEIAGKASQSFQPHEALQKAVL